MDAHIVFVKLNICIISEQFITLCAFTLRANLYNKCAIITKKNGLLPNRLEDLHGQ